MQRKTLSTELQQLKANGSSGQFEGYASVFGNTDLYGDIIVKGAFMKSLEGRSAPVAMLHQHDPKQVIGKWLSFKEDDHGLYAVAELTPNHSIAEDVKASLAHGAINGMSIGFDIPKDGSEYDQQKQVRVIKSIDLWEVSIVTFPANVESRIDIVKSIEAIKTISEAEELLRNVVGLSHKESKAFMHSLKSVALRDVENARIAEELQNAVSKFLS